MGEGVRRTDEGSPALTFYPLPRGEEITFARFCFANSLLVNPSAWIFKATVHVSPSPGGEDRGEDGR